MRSWWTRRTPREGRGRSSGRGRQQLPGQFLLRDFIVRVHFAEKVPGLWDFYWPSNTATKSLCQCQSDNDDGNDDDNDDNNDDDNDDEKNRASCRDKRLVSRRVRQPAFHFLLV